MSVNRRQSVLLKLQSIPQGTKAEMLSAAQAIIRVTNDEQEAQGPHLIESRIDFFQELLDDVRASTYFAAQDIAPKAIRSKIDQLYGQHRARATITT